MAYMICTIRYTGSLLWVITNVKDAERFHRIKPRCVTRAKILSPPFMYVNLAASRVWAPERCACPGKSLLPIIVKNAAPPALKNPPCANPGPSRPDQKHTSRLDHNQMQPGGFFLHQINPIKWPNGNKRNYCSGLASIWTGFRNSLTSLYQSQIRPSALNPRGYTGGNSGWQFEKGDFLNPFDTSVFHESRSLA